MLLSQNDEWMGDNDEVNVTQSKSGEKNEWKLPENASVDNVAMKTEKKSILKQK